MSILERHTDKWVPEPNTGCFLWTGAGDEGTVRPTVGIAGGKTAIVARLVCAEVYGPPPADKPLALHNTPNGCVGGLCVNGDHLRWGNRYENMMDVPTKQREAIAAHARAHIPPGPRNECKERTEARRTGEKTYFTGKSCKNGHISPRHVVSGDCIACRSAWNAQRIR